jgi:hypothetical protein
MPFLVQNLIAQRPAATTVRRNDPVSEALNLMVEHEFSQLPVVDLDNRPMGMVTYEGILRGIRNFGARLEDLHVRDVMTSASLFNLEDDLFELLEHLKRTYAVLIVDASEQLAGIVTSYDSTEYFRSRAENLMHVEDIEYMVKEFIRVAYTNEAGEIDAAKLAQAVSKVTPQDKTGDNNRQPAFEDLSLGQYILMLVSKSTWNVFEPIFQIPREALHKLLENVRITRNDLAHFRREITTVQIDQLRFCAGWLARCREEFDQARTQRLFSQLIHTYDATPQTPLAKREARAEYNIDEPSAGPVGHSVSGTQEDVGIIAEESGPQDSRYTPLADWLQSQPGRVDRLEVKFDEIEAVIRGSLPTSAFTHRAWWANDSQGHPHSKLWLEAGWRTTYLNLTEKRVVFARIQEREKAYIQFFGRLLADLRKQASFPVRNTSPDGTSWVVCQAISSPGFAAAWFNCSFSRGQRFRIELYIDTYDQRTTKQVFDRIYAHKDSLESQLGDLSWERIDNKRASRIAVYHQGAITDGMDKLASLRTWAVEKMSAFYNALEPVATEAFREVLAS